jgi:hypothetical protein
MFNVNQITSELAKMADPMLQKYASMHKNDPYTVALAVGESNRRKSLRTAAQGRMAGQQQPKVVDQDIAQMAAPVDYADAMSNMMGVLPENMGIGKLPAPNMQAMGKAEGGIVGYAAGKTVQGDFDPEAYRKYALEKAQTLGLDPMWVDRILSHESTTKRAPKGYDPDAVSPTGPTGIGQLAKATAKHYMKQAGHLAKGEKFDPEIRKDPYKNIDASLAFMVDLQNKYKGDPQKMAVGYNQGETYLDSHLAANKGELNVARLKDEPKNYLTRTGNLVTPGQPVQAAPAAQNMAALIPTGGTGSGPTPAAAKETGFLSPEYMENKFGLSPDVARNVYNTMMAPTPLAPASTLPKTGGYMSKAYQGLAGLGEKAYNKLVPSSKLSEEGIAALQAERAAERAAEAAKATQLRLTPPAAPLTEGSGVIPVTKTGQGVVQSAEELEKVRLANQAADQLAASQAAARAAEGVGNVPSAAEKIQTASLLREADEAQRLQNAAKTATNVKTNLATTQAPIGGISDLDAQKANEKEKESTATGVDQNAIEELKKKYAEEDGKKGTASSGFFNDPMGILGLQLMANKNPNLLGAVGEAGQGTAKYLSDLRKAESEQGYYGAKGEEARATAALYNRGAKDRNMQLEAEKLVQKGMEDWSKSTAGKLGGIQNPQAAQLEEARLRRIYYQQLGLSLTPLQSDTNVPVSGAGFKFLGARP